MNSLQNDQQKKENESNNSDNQQIENNEQFFFNQINQDCDNDSSNNNSMSNDQPKKLVNNQSNQQKESNSKQVDFTSNKLEQISRQLKDANFYGINKYIYSKDPKKKDEVQVLSGTEFQLLPNNPQFIFYEKDKFEPLYIPKQDILENSLRREIEKFCFADTLLNRIVYDSIDSSVYTKDLNPQDYDMEVLPFYIPQGSEDTTLIFESRFECGNLRRAIQISEFEYNLILRPDFYTQRNTQWFYFAISNTKKNKEYRFNIINMMKPDSLYNQGQKPLIYSEKQAKTKQVGFFHDGYEICYYQNNMKRKNGGYYYTLTFAIQFQYDQDTVYISHAYPYSYSMLRQHITAIEQDPNKKKKMQRKTLCQTIAGNDCPLLLITEFKGSAIENIENKKVIILSGRVHPGETQASFTVQYAIDYLLGSSIQAKTLRENFIFYIIPMLNIDGVVNGNYRCNLSGVDLNRQYMQPQKNLHPTIYYLKQLVKQKKDDKTLLFFCDFHGHSRKKNIFMYGCQGKDNLKREMVFPYLFRNNCPVFSIKDCNFQIQKEREGSARIALSKEFLLQNCYTLEVSFCGADFGKYEYYHFNQAIFKEIGESFCQSLLDLFEPEQVKVRQILDEIEQQINKNEKKNQDESSDGNSDYSNDDIKDIKDMKDKQDGSPNDQEQQIDQNGKNKDQNQKKKNVTVNKKKQK